jgi:hypothetical protein
MSAAAGAVILTESDIGGRLIGRPGERRIGYHTSINPGVIPLLGCVALGWFIAYACEFESFFWNAHLLRLFLLNHHGLL